MSGTRSTKRHSWRHQVKFNGHSSRHNNIQVNSQHRVTRFVSIHRLINRILLRQPRNIQNIRHVAIQRNSTQLRYRNSNRSIVKDLPTYHRSQLGLIILVSNRWYLVRVISRRAFNYHEKVKPGVRKLQRVTSTGNRVNVREQSQLRPILRRHPSRGRRYTRYRNSSRGGPPLKPYVIPLTILRNLRSDNKLDLRSTVRRSRT